MKIPQTLQEPLQEALVNDYGGEVVVRGGPNKGRIYVFKGSIAWITCDTIATRLRDVLAEQANLAQEDLEAALKESHASRRNFGETLIQWGLIDETQLRACLLTHNAAHFTGLVAFGERAQAMFVPQDRKYSGRLLYSLEEVVRTADALARAPTEQLAELRSTHTVVPNCDFVFFSRGRGHTPRIHPEDVVSADLLDRMTRAAQDMMNRHRFAALEPAEDGPQPPRELVLFGPGGFCLLRRARRDPRALYGIACTRVRNLGLSLGMARSALRTVCDGPQNNT